MKPIPKNMLPGRHEGRRSARARVLQNKYQNEKAAVNVDAAEHNEQLYVMGVVTEYRWILKHCFCKSPDHQHKVRICACNTYDIVTRQLSVILNVRHVFHGPFLFFSFQVEL